MDDLYYDSVIEKVIVIPPQHINKNINKSIEKLLIDQVGDKCVDNYGYISKDSIKIKKISDKKISGSRLNGSLESNVIFNANVCNPSINSVIKANINSIAKLGFNCKKGPLNILVASQIHRNPELLSKYQENDEISITILKTKFEANSNEITVIGRLTEDMPELDNKKNKKDNKKAVKDKITASKNQPISNNNNIQKFQSNNEIDKGEDFADEQQSESDIVVQSIEADDDETETENDKVNMEGGNDYYDSEDYVSDEENNDENNDDDDDNDDDNEEEQYFLGKNGNKDEEEIEDIDDIEEMDDMEDMDDMGDLESEMD